MEVELVLINGERRTLVLPQHSGSVAAALDRLDDWIETKDGGWVQKKFVVELRRSPRTPGGQRSGGSDEELQQLREAAESLADQVDERTAR